MLLAVSAPSDSHSLTMARYVSSWLTEIAALLSHSCSSRSCPFCVVFLVSSFVFFSVRLLSFFLSLHPVTSVYAVLHRTAWYVTRLNYALQAFLLPTTRVMVERYSLPTRELP